MARQASVCSAVVILAALCLPLPLGPGEAGKADLTSPRGTSDALASPQAEAPATEHWLDARVAASLSAPLGDRPWIHMGEWRGAASRYRGAAELTEALERNLVRPLALAQGDFDEDGVSDLVSAYALEGKGILTLHRGNEDALYPNSPQARERQRAGTFSDSPFLSPTPVIAVPERPDFLGTGDFDADGHLDVVASAAGGEALYLLRGDGDGGFHPAERHPLPGRITSLATGEINRPDALTDVAVGIVGERGPELRIFESPQGALRGAPETHRLDQPATAVVLERLDEDAFPDLALAAGSEVWVVLGRDRPLVTVEGHPSSAPARIERLSLPSEIASMAAGDFSAEGRKEIALLSREGAVYVGAARALLDLAREGADPSEALVASGEIEAPEAILARARLSTLAGECLLVVDRVSDRMHVRVPMAGAAGEVSGGGELPPGGRLARPRWESLDAMGQVVAVLPMRLNGDALSDLVVLREDQSEPAVLQTEAVRTFTVNSTGDEEDIKLIDGVCDSSTAEGEQCTLRAAIQQANASSGMDAIHFSIALFRAVTILPKTALPAVTEAVVIDGTTAPFFRGDPVVQLNGSEAGAGASGLSIAGGNSTVRGLAINGFVASATGLGGSGVELRASGANVVEGCVLGPLITGEFTAGNTRGVHIGNSPGNRIGGTSGAARNVISQNQRGVWIAGAGATGNQVLGNFIGTDASGTVDLGISGSGIVINEASGNTLGGSTTGARNVISGNENDGVVITGAGASGNQVLGNFIGADASGTRVLRNLGHGVSIDGASSNTMGGAAAGAGNVIFGYTGSGVRVSGSAENRILGNLVGTDAAGSVSMGIGLRGVEISSGLRNEIGGALPGARNLVSGNTDVGVLLTGSSDNMIQGNFIGTDVAGGAAIANRSGGVRVEGGSGNIVGGATEGAGNLISGNRDDGVVFINSAGNQVQGNRIGTDATGNLSLGNGLSGIVLFGSSSNVFGGTTPESRNLISGNGLAGVVLRVSSDNTIQGNFIGTDVAGGAVIANGPSGVDGSDGVRIEGGGGNTVGGATDGAGNLISGNGDDGVVFFNSTGNQVQGNRIGTDVTGSLRLGNRFSGVALFGSSSNVIGGTTPESRNLISGNGFTGVFLSGSSGNMIQGNFIGTDLAGGAAIANGSGGVRVIGGSGNAVGGTTDGTGNLISGNGFAGIWLTDGASLNQVQGNFIGTDVTGSIALGNAADGVLITTLASDNTIGGAAPGAGNRIAFNGGRGVQVGPPVLGTIRNSLSQNSIFTNGGLGIDLTASELADGVTPNDPQDTDAGPNGLQNFPALTSVIADGAGTTVSGRLNSAPNTQFVVELFSSPECDPSGHGEGESFLASIKVQTDANGDTDFLLPLPNTTAVGQFFTATATDPQGNTSEFSPCLRFVPSLAVGANRLDDTGGNLDGRIDAGECVGLLVRLENRTGESTSPATGIVAILSSDTPGVLVTQAASAYADLPVGGSAENLVPFQLEVSPDFPCGSPIDLTLDVSTNQGGLQVPLQLQTAPAVLSGVSSYEVTGPVPVPDNNPAGAALPLTVSGIEGRIAKVTASVVLAHTFDQDLTLRLSGPDGTLVLLSAQNGGSGRNYGTDCPAGGSDTTFDDEAAISIRDGTAPFVGSFRPEEPLAAFAGKSGPAVNGTWTLLVTDGAAADTGSIECWSLTIEEERCPLPADTCPMRPREVSPPGSDQPLRFADEVTLHWEEKGRSASLEFNLYRGEGPVLRLGSYGTCLQAGVSTNTATDPEAPPGARAWFYIVTGENTAGEGPMGLDSTGTPRLNSNPCP